MNLRSLLGHLNSATFSAIQMMTFTFIPLMAEKGSLSLSSVILSFSVGSFLFLWSSPFWAAQSDRHGRMKILAVGMLGVFVSSGLILFLLLNPGSILQNELLMWGSRLLYGLTASAVVPVAQALQIDLHPEQTALKSMLSNSMSLNIGRALGPLTLLLGGASNMLGILQLATMWSFVLLVLNILGTRQSLPNRAGASEQSLIKSWWSDVIRVQDVVILALLFTSYIGILNFSLASLLKKTFELTSADSSVLMAQVLLGSAILAVVIQAIGKMLFKNPWQGAMVFGAVSLLLGSLVLQYMENKTELGIAITFLSVGISLIPPCYLALMAARGSQDHFGRRAGLAAAANTIGYAVGGAIASFTFKINLISIEMVMTLVSVLMIASIALLYKNRNREAKYV